MNIWMCRLRSVDMQYRTRVAMLLRASSPVKWDGSMRGEGGEVLQFKGVYMAEFGPYCLEILAGSNTMRHHGCVGLQYGV